MARSMDTTHQDYPITTSRAFPIHRATKATIPNCLQSCKSQESPAKTDSEPGSLHQKKTRQCTTSMGSNRRNGDLRPLAASGRTPLKSNDIMENMRYRAIIPMVDIKVQFKCKDSEFESHKVTEQEGRVLGHKESIEMKKIICKGDEDIKESHLNEQLEEFNGVSIRFSRDVGYNKVGMETYQLIKSILHHNQDMLTTVAGSTGFKQNLAPTLKKQADTQESDVPKVNFESHLDIAAVTIEDEHKHEENCKSQEMGIITKRFSKKSLMAERTQHDNIMKINKTVQGCVGGSKTNTTDTHFQNKNPTLEGTETVIGFSEAHVEDAQVQLLDGDVVHSCSRLTSVLCNHSIENFDHKQPEFANTKIELEQSDEGLSLEKVANLDKPNNALDITLVPEHECSLQTPHTSTKIFPVMQGNVFGFNGDNQPNEPQGSIVILPSMETYNYFTIKELGCDLEFCVQHPSESNSRILLMERDEEEEA
nr:hypothetical protein [Tanacetum cinerariifolium]